MIKYTSKLICFVLISSCCSSAIAQTLFCPPNINFEEGTLNNWEFFTGTCCPVSVPTAGIVTNRHTLTSGNNTDPYGRFTIVSPSGGSYSLRLGNDSIGAQAERARYYVHVPSGTGKHMLLYRYAVVLENPGHPAHDQPVFEVAAFDSVTNALVPCSDVSYVSSSSLPGFIRSNYSLRSVYYKPWTTATIDLSAYAGRTVAIDFSSGDCGQGGHFGYGYVDMNCGLFQIEGTICNGDVNNITLNGPQGYQYYEWRDAGLSTVLGTSQALVIPPPTSSTTFAVILTPYPGYGCQDTIYTTYTTPSHSNISLNAYGDTTICIGAKTLIRSIASGGNGPFVYDWSPSTGLSCNNCDNPQVTGTINTIYTVIATDQAGCSDTGKVTIGVDSFVKARLFTAADTVCSSNPVTIINTMSNNPPNKTQVWSVPGASILSGAGLSDTAVVKYNTGGAKRIVLTISLGECRTQDTLDIFIGDEFAINTTPGDTICPDASKQLNVTNNSQLPITYSWVPSASLSCSNCPNPTATPAASTNYIVYATDMQGCFDTGFINIIVDSTTNASFLTALDTICVNELLGVKNIGENPKIIGYLWSVDTGQVVYGDGTDSISVFWTTPGRKKITNKAFRGSCFTLDSQYVEVLPIPPAGFELPQYACVGTPVEMFPLAGAPQYKWYAQEHDIDDIAYKEKYELNWTTTGTKTVKLVVSDHHCIDSFTKEISIHPFPIAEITLDNNGAICKGKELKLSATKGFRYNYAWQPAALFRTNNEAEVIANVERTEGYYLQVTNQWGCSSFDSVLVVADPCCDIPMPDAFTPNNDGHNDRFRPINMDRKTLVHLMIANRRGQIVFESSDAGSNWDGTYNGLEAGQDTYYYYIKYICNNTDEMVKKGSVILLR